jgi:hypothetical protein
MDSWGSLDILSGFEPADPRSNRGESVFQKTYIPAVIIFDHAY